MTFASVSASESKLDTLRRNNEKTLVSYRAIPGPGMDLVGCVLAMVVLGRLKVAPGMLLRVMAAVCYHKRAPLCALRRLAHGAMLCSRVLLPAQAL
eukprot:scaffold234258_cov17-Tisochrysis_lutea.AAC.1